MTAPAVELKDVFRVHSTPEGDAAALQGLSLRVGAGEVLTVLGPSGSGKTTLLRILAGLDRPSAGSVRVFGTEIAKLPDRRLAAYRSGTTGYADQHYSRALASELTARELVALQLGLRGEPRRAQLARADELLERVGLESKRDQRPPALSGGEQQRVALCSALAHRPRLLLADEPTGELDRANADLVYRLVAELGREQRCTTVIVSHDPESAAIADRIVRIRDGRVSEEFVREDDAGDTIVVGRGGWLRLPEELLARAGIGDRAVARLDGHRVVVSPPLTGSDPVKAAGSAQSQKPAPIASAAPGTVVARGHGLLKRYGSTPVFAGLSCEFRAGTFHVVTGPSGSGKTTLLQLLAGLELPDDGEISVLDRSLAALEREERAAIRRESIAYVGQQVGLVPFLSARENVELGLAVRGRPPDGALDALTAVGLAERAEQRVERLSTGERGRVAVARALAAEPALLLADEPTSRLDQANAIAVGALLARLAAERGTAIVCATHDPVVIDQADAELAL